MEKDDKNVLVKKERWMKDYKDREVNINEGKR